MTNDSERLIEEIRRQGRLTRWTVFGMVVAATVALGMLLTDWANVARWAGRIVIYGMMAAMVIAIVRSLWSREGERRE